MVAACWLLKFAFSAGKERSKETDISSADTELLQKIPQYLAHLFDFFLPNASNLSLIKFSSERTRMKKVPLQKIPLS